jgi:hypothetical protein
MRIFVRSCDLSDDHTHRRLTTLAADSDEPRCKVLHTWKDPGPHNHLYPFAAKTDGEFQEFRQELQAAETKDKKYTKRKTVLKKIVANITMGNDSACGDAVSALMLTVEFCLQCQLCSPTLCNVWGPHYWRSRRVRLRVLSSARVPSPGHFSSGLPLSH